MKRAFVSTVALVLSSLSLGACVSAPPSEQGRGFYNAGNYLFAAAAFTEDIGEHPRSAAAWNNRAVTRVRLNDLNGAIRDHNRAVALAPDDPEIHFNRGSAAALAGKPDPARREAIARLMRLLDTPR